jgi:hypothetical protein
MEEKIKGILPEPPKEDVKVRERRQKTLNYCKSIIEEVLGYVAGYGESMILSKEVQSKFQQRPVRKDVFISLQEHELDVIDLLPRSLCASAQTGRVGFLDRDGVFTEYDLVNKTRLRRLNISTKVPLNKSKIIDFIFEAKTGKIFTLNEKMLLESWELHQSVHVPLNRVKVIAVSETEKSSVDEAYVNRYQGIFPTYLSMSSNSTYLLVNCSFYNNSIVLVDPVSLSIVSKVYLRASDMKLPGNMSKILALMKPYVLDLQKNGVDFQRMFGDVTMKDDSGIECVRKDEFVRKFREHVKSPDIKDSDCKFL